MAYLMGIDIGGTMVKAAIYDMDGNEIAVHGEKLHISYPHSGQNERDMYEVKDMSLKAIKDVIEKAGILAVDRHVHVLALIRILLSAYQFQPRVIGYRQHAVGHAVRCYINAAIHHLTGRDLRLNHVQRDCIRCRQ